MSGHGNSSAESAILEATERLLDEIPVHELSVARIINAAGISRATFYFYFSSKFAVLAALVEQAIAEIYAVSRPTVGGAGGLPPELALSKRIRDSAQVWAAHFPVMRATAENWHVYPELRTLWLEMIGGLTDAIAAEIDAERAAGRAPDGPDSRALASTLTWTTERCLYVIGLSLPSGPNDPDAMLAALAQIWLTAIYGPDAAQTAARAAAA